MSSDRRIPAAERARSQIRRGSERAGRAGARISRSLGEPALFAILLSAVVSVMFLSPMVTERDSGLRRAPLQVGHGTDAM